MAYKILTKKNSQFQPNICSIDCALFEILISGIYTKFNITLRNSPQQQSMSDYFIKDVSIG
jgi:hypothetical protein